MACPPAHSRSISDPGRGRAVSRRRYPLVRTVFAFLMVPVVIFLTPGASSAATMGPWVPVALSVPIAGDILGDNVPGQGTCAFSLQHTGTYSINVGQGSCFGLPDVTWGYSQPMEAGSSFTITVNGLTEAGVPCTGSQNSTFGPHAKNGTIRVAGTITPGSFGVNAPDCSIGEVCFTVPGTSTCEEEAVPFPEDQTPVIEGCPFGTPSVHLTVEAVGVPPGGGFFNWEYVANFSLSGAPPVSTAAWGVQSVSLHAPGNGIRKRLDSTRVVLSSAAAHTSNMTPPVIPPEHGMEVYGWPLPAPDDWNDEPPRSGHPGDPYAGTVPTSLPTGPDQPYYGITDPEHCRFFFGAKVLSFEGTTQDDPQGDGVGPVTPPPPVVDPGPDPVEPEPDPIAEPETEKDWLGMIWALLRSIWSSIVSGFQSVVNALSGIGQTIADAILGAFDGMFVPTDGFMETRYSSVQSNYEQTSPAKYLAAVDGFTVGSASGCGGLPLNVTLPGGVEVSESIGAACSGPMASAAGVTRAVLTAVIVISGLLACLRALGAGLGWDPGIGSRGAAA